MVKIGSVTAEILLTLSSWWVVVGGGGGGGVQSHFQVKPNCYVGLWLGWGFDKTFLNKKMIYSSDKSTTILQCFLIAA